jgi:hypothetical protein
MGLTSTCAVSPVGLGSHDDRPWTAAMLLPAEAPLRLAVFLRTSPRRPTRGSSSWPRRPSGRPDSRTRRPRSPAGRIHPERPGVVWGVLPQEAVDETPEPGPGHPGHPGDGRRGSSALGQEPLDQGSRLRGHRAGSAQDGRGTGGVPPVCGPPGTDRHCGQSGGGAGEPASFSSLSGGSSWSRTRSTSCSSAPPSDPFPGRPGAEGVLLGEEEAAHGEVPGGGGCGSGISSPEGPARARPAAVPGIITGKTHDQKVYDRTRVMPAGGEENQRHAYLGTGGYRGGGSRWNTGSGR